MSKYCLLSIAIQLIPFEPDGTECTICGDMIFLEGKQAIFVTPVDGKKVGSLDYRFCQSCGEAMVEIIEEGEDEDDDDELNELFRSY